MCVFKVNVIVTKSLPSRVLILICYFNSIQNVGAEVKLNHSIVTDFVMVDCQEYDPDAQNKIRDSVIVYLLLLHPVS